MTFNVSPYNEVYPVDGNDSRLLETNAHLVDVGENGEALFEVEEEEAFIYDARRQTFHLYNADTLDSSYRSWSDDSSAASTTYLQNSINTFNNNDSFFHDSSSLRSMTLPIQFAPPTQPAITPGNNNNNTNNRRRMTLERIREMSGSEEDLLLATTRGEEEEDDDDDGDKCNENELNAMFLFENNDSFAMNQHRIGQRRRGRGSRSTTTSQGGDFSIGEFHDSFSRNRRRFGNTTTTTRRLQQQEATRQLQQQQEQIVHSGINLVDTTGFPDGSFRDGSFRDGSFRDGSFRDSSIRSGGGGDADTVVSNASSLDVSLRVEDLIPPSSQRQRQQQQPFQLQHLLLPTRGGFLAGGGGIGSSGSIALSSSFVDSEEGSAVYDGLFFEDSWAMNHQRRQQQQQSHQMIVLPNSNNAYRRRQFLRNGRSWSASRLNQNNNYNNDSTILQLDHNDSMNNATRRRIARHPGRRVVRSNSTASSISTTTSVSTSSSFRDTLNDVDENNDDGLLNTTNSNHGSIGTISTTTTTATTNGSLVEPTTLMMARCSLNNTSRPSLHTGSISNTSSEQVNQYSVSSFFSQPSLYDDTSMSSFPSITVALR